MYVYIYILQRAIAMFSLDVYGCVKLGYCTPGNKHGTGCILYTAVYRIQQYTTQYTLHYSAYQRIYHYY